jgi:hypothetical protein
MYRTAEALRDAMIELGVACDGGKDSLSMAASAGGEVVLAPGNLVISAYAACPDVTQVITPDTKQPGSYLLHVDISRVRASMRARRLRLPRTCMHLPCSLLHAHMHACVAALLPHFCIRGSLERAIRQRHSAPPQWAWVHASPAHLHSGGTLAPAAAALRAPACMLLMRVRGAAGRAAAGRLRAGAGVRAGGG